MVRSGAAGTTLAAGPHAMMRSPSTTTAASSSGSAPVPSMRVQFTRAVSTGIFSSFSSGRVFFGAEFHRHSADVRVVQRTPLHALDDHDHAAQGVGADNPRVGTHPIVGMGGSLFGRQQRNGGLERVQAEPATIRQPELAALQL